MAVVRVAPVPALRGTAQGAVGQVADPSRAAPVGDLRPRGPDRAAARLGRHRRHPPRRRGVRRARRRPSRRRAASSAGCGCGACGPPPALDCDNAGTLMRLLAGVLVGQAARHVVLDGDDSLRGRPMTRIARPLRAMGAGVFTAPGGTPPIVVSGGRAAAGHRAPPGGRERAGQELPAAGRALRRGRDLGASSRSPSRDHTERMLEAAGVAVLREGGAVGVRGPVGVSWRSPTSRCRATSRRPPPTWWPAPSWATRRCAFRGSTSTRGARACWT